MTFNPTTAIPVVERPDGLMERDTFNPTTATPIDESIPQLRADKNPRYRPPLTDEQRAQATVELTLKEQGKEVPWEQRVDWALRSPTAKMVTSNIVGWMVPGAKIIPIYNALKGISNASSPNSDVGKMVFDSAYKGLAENKEVDNLGGAAAKAYPDAPWQITGAMGAVAETLMFMPSVVKGAAEFLSPSNQFNMAFNNFRQNSPKWGDLVSHISKKIDQPIEVVEPALAREVYKIKKDILKDTNYFKLLNENLKNATGIDLASEVGSVGPKVGQKVGFKDTSGLVKFGKIKEIQGERAIIDLEGRDVVATLSQLSIPDVPMDKIENKTKETIGNLPKEKLVVANIGADEKIYVGNPGDLHFSLSEKYSDGIRKSMDLKPGDPTWKELGFIGADGKFLTREEALKVSGIKTNVNYLDAKEYQIKNGLKKPSPTPSPSEQITQEKSETVSENKIINTIPEEIKPNTKGVSRLQIKLENLKTDAAKAEFTKETLGEIKNIRSEFKNSIRKYEGDYLKEELSAIPKYYITKEGGIPPDEAMQQLRDKGIEINNESDLAEYLSNLDETKKSLEGQLDKLKPKIVKMKETTLVKEKLKSAESAQKETQKAMEKQLAEEEKLHAKEELKAFRQGKKMGAEMRKQRYFGAHISPQQRRDLYVVALDRGVIYTDYAGKQHDKLQGIIKYYKGASFDQLKEYLSNLSGDPENPARLFKLYGDINKDSEALKVINEAREDWQDITPIEVNTLDPARIVEKVSKQDLWNGNVLADNTFNVIAAADEAMFDRKVQELGDLDKNRQGIMANSKPSEEIMRKFEAKEPLTDQEKKVVDFLRGKYDAFIKEANEMRALLGKKPIPYRQDYMTHIKEQNLLHDFFRGNERGMENISQAQMDAIRKGDYTKGDMPFNRFALERKGPKTKFDAIGNYLQYMNVILREIYMTPAISHSRKFIDYALNKQPNAFKAMDRMLNDLKGKVSIVDQNLIGNIASSYPVKWLRSHIARSALIGNINFWAMNISNFSTGYAELGNYTNVGITKFLGSKKWRDFAFKNSKQLKGRAIDPDFMDQPVHTKLEEFVGGVTNLIEYNNVGSTFLGAYFRGVDKLGYSQEKAIDYADTIARRTQVGYKPYEVNAWMRSNSGKLMSQFQNWSFNAMNHILYDLGVANIPEDFASMFTKDKKSRTRWGAFLTLVTSAIVFNSIYKALGLREPYKPQSAIPGVAGITPGRYNDIGPTKIVQNMGTMITAKKAETKKRAAVRVAASVVPGGAQATRISEGKIFPEKKEDKKKKKTYY